MIGIVRRVKTDLTQMTSIWTKEESSGTVVGMMAKALTLIAYNMADKSKIEFTTCDHKNSIDH